MTNLVEVTIPTPVIAEDSTLEAAKSFTITCAEQSVELQTIRRALNTSIKALEEQQLAITRPMNAAKQKIIDFFATPLNARKAALRACDAEIIRWNRQVEADRREAQRREEEAAEKERRRLQAIADEARVKAEMARLLGEEAERHDTKAEVFEERAATHVAPVVQIEKGKAEGVSMRDNWTFDIHDESTIPRAYLTADTVKIGKLVKAMKADAASVLGKGVRVYNAPVVASRRAT